MELVRQMSAPIHDSVLRLLLSASCQQQRNAFRGKIAVTAISREKMAMKSFYLFLAT